MGFKAAGKQASEYYNMINAWKHMMMWVGSIQMYSSYIAGVFLRGGKFGWENNQYKKIIIE